MKKILLFALLLAGANVGIFAQVNPFTPPSGALPNATVGAQYTQTDIISFTIPSTATIDPASFGALPGGITVPPFDADIDTVKFIVVGLPAGLTAVFDNGTGIYLAGASGTLSITGIATSSTTADSIIIESQTSGSGTLQVPLVGALPITFPGTVTTPLGAQDVPAAPGVFDGGPYSMMTVGVQELNFSKFDVIQNIPNPFTGNTLIKFSMPTAGNVDFTVFDMIGKRVHAEKIQAQSKANTISFSSEKLAPGSYFYSLSNGTKTITKKMIVAGK